MERPTGVQQQKQWQYHPQYSLSSLWWSHCYGELLHLLHALRYLAGKGAAPLVDHLIAWFSDLMKMDSGFCSADVLLRWSRCLLLLINKQQNGNCRRARRRLLEVG